MVDTRDLKSLGSNTVRVRVSSWAPLLFCLVQRLKFYNKFNSLNKLKTALIEKVRTAACRGALNLKE